MPTVERRERKHLLDDVEVALTHAALSSAMQRDPSAPGGRYHVRSVYFDDPADSTLEAKLAGLRDRHRWRLRIYDRSDRRVRLERKRRSDRFEAKDATLVSRAVALALLAGRLPDGPREDELLWTFVAEQRASLLRPVVLVDYLREAHVHPTCQLRVTLDRDLRATARCELFDPDLPTLPVLEGRRRAILEVKSTGGEPSWVDALLPASLLPPDALSKYVMARSPWKEEP